MSGDRSAEEVLANHVDVLGEDFGWLFNKLQNEVIWLHAKWAHFAELFGTKSSRIDLLNKAAPKFFHTVQDSLWETIILHIARITDPPESMGKANLSVFRLPSLIDDDSLRSTVEELLERLKDKTQFARTARNKFFAHKDLGQAMLPDGERATLGSRADIRVALEYLALVLNEVSGHYLDSTMMYKMVPHEIDAAGLLYVIDDGLSWQEKELEWIKSGELDWRTRSKRHL